VKCSFARLSLNTGDAILQDEPEGSVSSASGSREAKRTKVVGNGFCNLDFG
jgi:hypothetical protein